MDKDFALKLAAEIGIDVQQIIREETELVFLRALFDSPLSDKLVFKGGTALRLIYGSPRFSEGLDFSVTGKIDPAEFKESVSNIVKSDERLSIKDIASKYYTDIAQIRIKEPWRDMAFSMKIEISKRIIKNAGFASVNALAKSPTTNISVMAKTYAPEEMLKDKLRAINERKMPRDIFDIWFICQKLNKPFDIKKFGYPKGIIRRDLRRLLPKRFYPVVEDLERLNA
ncbi:nucleotidyl transferase AbiEii/AbiGii toxin family protein [Omnitrophica bacterium]|nr:nucleotidyl transferase AbiEii/AbiGii toxin family protein [Candidatus Omnitrophota bacterium]